ncbi:hypothetical protein H0H93_011863 [Arthromyces matolae]|nr:hypothetical protein H0H93_011863 [Arthromyces matolae]
MYAYSILPGIMVAFDEDEVSDTILRRNDLTGIMFDWNTRKVATGTLTEKSQVAAERHLESIVKSPALSDDVIYAMRTLMLTDTIPPRMETRDLDSRLDSIEDLKRSNWRPSAIAASQLSGELATHNSDLLRLDYDILRLQLDIEKSHAEVKALVTERLQKQKAADKCQAWLSSVRLLPLDVLARIFKYAKSDDVDSEMSTLTLSHVCSSWRNAALDCRSLWNDLVLELWSPERSTSLASLLNFWYGRSNASLPLFLSLSVKDDLDESTGETLTQTLTERSTRLQVFRLSISGVNYDPLNAHQFLRPFLGRSGDSFPVLRELVLVDHTRREDLDITVFENSPRLQRVVLNLEKVTVGRARNLLPWAQLTHLRFGGIITVTTFIEVFFNATQLVHAEFFHVSVSTDDEDVFLSDDLVTFPHLRHLTIRSDSALVVGHDFGGEFNHALRKARMPQLRHLALLNGYLKMDSGGMLVFPDTLLGTNVQKYSLVHLTLSNINCEDLTVFHVCVFLSMCPFLQRLNLHLDLPPLDLLRALTSKGDDADDNIPEPPKLHYLTSFLFGFQADRVHESVMVDDVAKSFSALAFKWINQPDKTGYLNRLTLCMCDGTRAFFYTQDYSPVTDRVTGLIEDGLGEHARDVRLKVYALNSYEHVISFMDSDDPTREIPEPL